MDTSPLFSDEIDDTKDNDENKKNGKDQKLLLILEEYKELLEIQASERKQLLKQVDTLTQRTGDIDNLDNKIEHLVRILGDIRQQISALSTAVPSNLIKTKEKKSNIGVPSIDSNVVKQSVLASDQEIDELSKNIEEEANDLDEEIDTLTQLIEDKSEELRLKDNEIGELNLELESVSDEKERLALQLENLNSVINSWQGQLNLLQKLASSDPRYKVIAALKKHGSLSDIQLAFTMGTSISQIRKYVEDLRELDLVRKDNSGRYQWMGSKVSKDEFQI